VKKHEPDVKKHEPDIKKFEPDVKKHEPDVKKHEPDIKKFEPDVKKHEPDIKKFEPDVPPIKAEPEIPPVGPGPVEEGAVGGFFSGEGAGQIVVYDAALEERLQRIEAALAQLTHFIQASQRPDVSKAALRREDKKK